MKNASESLAGRISYLELSPFVIEEIGVKKQKDLWFFGGYPDGGILSSKKFPLWQKDYLTAMSSRDLPELGLTARPSQIARLFSLLASAHGQYWNASEIAKSMGVTYHTINQYVSYLEEIFLVRKIPTYSPRNIKKRLIKAPKFYWRDSGLLHQILGFRSFDDLINHRVSGFSYEGFVIEQILNSLMSKGIDFEPFCFRTSDGHELDLVLKIGSKIIAIEIKMTSSPTQVSTERLQKTSKMIKADQALLICNSKKNINGGYMKILSLQAAIENLCSI